MTTANELDCIFFNFDQMPNAMKASDSQESSVQSHLDVSAPLVETLMLERKQFQLIEKKMIQHNVNLIIKSLNGPTGKTKVFLRKQVGVLSPMPFTENAVWN